MLELRLCPDQEARDRALDPRGSFLVQAPAGSGKTGLLTQRYLTLLATVQEPEEILAITFTRKAAGEMRHRILKALGRAHEAPPEEPFARRTWELAKAVLQHEAEKGWDLEANPSRLRVQTIDSLCHGLARQMPILSQFGAPLETVDDASDLYRQAAQATLQALESDTRWAAPVERLLRHLDNDVNRVERLVSEMLARRDQWLRHVATPSLRPQLEEGLRRALREELAALRALVPSHAVEDLLDLARYAASHQAVEIAPLAACRSLPGVEAEDAPAWQALAKFLLTGQKAWRKKVDQRNGFPAAGKGPGAEERRLRKEEFVALCEDLAGCEGLLQRLAAVDKLPPPAYLDSQWEILESFFQVLVLAAGQLQLAFRESGRCDFTEFSLKAVAALGPEDAPTDLALALDYRIRHLLVDEFQDTAVSQFRLLERLTAGWEPGDGRTLFLVGDPMQSIYRFRDAEVGLFLQAQEEGLGTVRLEPLRLTANFRSQAGLVEWFNDCFRRVFPSQQDRNTGAVTYSEAVASRDGLPGAAVQVHALFSDDLRVEAERVVDVIRNEDPSSTCAVLVRSREHLREILPLLRASGLQFQAVELERLDTRPVVQDLLALTRALLHTGDRIAWMAVLRAPWSGLTMKDLTRLAEANPDVSVWDALQTCDRAARVREVLRAALAGRRRQSLRRWVEGTWMALGGPACLSTPGELDDALAYLALLDGFDEEGLLPDVADLEARLRKLFAHPDPTASPRLQVMTVHRSKGLEFDVVVLPGLGRRTRPPDQPLMLWAERLTADGEVDLLLGPIAESGRDKDPVYAFLASVESQRETNEGARLLYVAATRAIRRLHVFGHTAWNQEALEVLDPPAGSMLGLLWPVVQREFAHAALLAGGLLAGEAGEEEPPAVQGVLGLDFDDALPPLCRLAEDWVLPDPPPPAAPARMLREETLEEIPDFRWAGETVRHVGTLVHRVLRQGSCSYDRGVFAKSLARLGVPSHELDEACDTAVRAVEGLLACPRGRWILDPSHTEARGEYALAGVVKNRVVRVKMDRTFVDAEGTRWIIDYKTGSHEGSDVEAFLDAEQERYRPQLERYALLMRRRDPRPIRLGLYFPLLGGWREWAAPGGGRGA